MGRPATKNGKDPARPIGRQKGTALHHQIFLVLRERILNGQFPVASMLPPEDELARNFGVSRVTIRAALAPLTEEGLVERRQGVGTFVASQGHAHAARFHTEVSDLIAEITEIGRTTTVELLEFDYVRAPAAIRAVFRAGEDAVFQRSVRLRKSRGRPIFYITTFVPQGIAKHFTREQLEAATLYRLLAESGVQIASGSQVVSAQLADPVVASHLGVAVGAALLLVRRQFRDPDGDLIGHVEILASPERFEVHLSLDTGGLPVAG